MLIIKIGGISKKKTNQKILIFSHIRNEVFDKNLAIKNFYVLTCYEYNADRLNLKKFQTFNSLF